MPELPIVRGKVTVEVSVPFVTVTVTGNVPLIPGVPEMTPAVEQVKLAGSPEHVQVLVPVPPWLVNVSVYGCPTVPFGSVEVLTTTPDPTTRPMVFEFVDSSESITVIVTGYVPGPNHQ